MSAIPQASRDLAAILECAATPEKVIWASHPDKGQIVSYRLRNGHWGAVFFAAFSVFWMAGASGVLFGTSVPGAFGYIFPLFGLPFLVIGLYMLVAPWLEAAQAPRTLFAITESRVLHVSPGFSGVTTKSLVAGDMVGVSLVENIDGSGTLSITLAEREAEGKGSRSKTLDMIGVADAATAMRLVEAMRSGRKP